LDRRTAITPLCVAAILIALFPPSRTVAASYSSDWDTIRQGPEVLASNNPDGGDLRCEPSIAVYGNVVLVSWNDSYGGAHTIPKSPIGISVGWAISLDRGKTFKFGGYLPQNEAGGVFTGADSWLAADGAGNFYLEVLSGDSPQEMRLYYMDHQNLGRWQRMTNIVEGGGLDKPAISALPDGRVGVAYNDNVFNSGTLVFAIYFAMSKDKGKSWDKPIKLTDSSAKTRLGASVTMTKTRTLVAWAEGGRQPDEVWWTDSMDGGKTFAPPTMLFKSKEHLPSPRGYTMGLGYPMTISSFPWVTSSASFGHDTFYLTYAEGAGQGSRVLMFALLPGGKTWSQPATVGDSPTQAIKVMPSVAMVGSRPAILYYDRRNGPDSALTDVYLSILGKGTKFEDIKLNSVSTDWTKTPGDKQYAPIQRNFGDYITLASDGNSLAAAWTDGRQGVPRIYARVIGTQ
jgi:hypothetical protein